MPRAKKTAAELSASPFADRLKLLLKEARESQEILAKKLGITRQTVSQYCTGQSEPGYANLCKIAEHYEVTTDYLLGLSDDPVRKPSAVDELGLSPATIQKIKMAYKEVEACNPCFEGVDDGYYLAAKRIIFDDLISSILGSRLCSEIFLLKCDIQSEKQREPKEYNVLDFRDFLGDWNKTQKDYDYSQRIQLEEALTRLYPDLAGRFRVSYGLEVFDMKISSICDEFKNIVKEITGYTDMISSDG